MPKGLLGNGREHEFLKPFAAVCADNQQIGLSLSYEILQLRPDVAFPNIKLAATNAQLSFTLVYTSQGGS
jgi:hypothetical protein